MNHVFSKRHTRKADIYIYIYIGKYVKLQFIVI